MSRSRTRRYGPKASNKVEKAMHEMKRATLRSGRSGRKVRSRKQAIRHRSGAGSQGRRQGPGESRRDAQKATAVTAVTAGPKESEKTP